jgi:hypothetical protein
MAAPVLFQQEVGVAQMKYTAFDIEFLAVKLAVHHFLFLLDGREFII